jgi:hypothetical protein
MILPALRWIVGAVQAVVEGISAGRRLVREARRGTLPNHDGETDPIPLTSKDVRHIQDQIRSATETRPEIRPPAPRAGTRYD